MNVLIGFVLYWVGFVLSYYLIKLHWMRFQGLSKWTNRAARDARKRSLISWVGVLIMTVAIIVALFKKVKRAWFIIMLPLSLLISCNNKFYDGEGNRIPKRAVHLLVRDQFVVINEMESKYLDKYFYFRPLQKIIWIDSTNLDTLISAEDWKKP